MNAAAHKLRGDELSAANGPRVFDPRDFCGQKLVVIFCPADSRAASAEIEAYCMRADAFQQAGAWLVAVAPALDQVPSSHGNDHIALVVDPDGLAFQMLAAAFPMEVTDSAEAVAFLVDRDGIARHVWTGRGRAEEVLAGVRERP